MWRGQSTTLLIIVAWLFALSTFVSAYDSKAGAYPTAYSNKDISSQRLAGQKLLTDLQAANVANVSSFTIPPGVYRINSTLEIDSTINFTLTAADVEVICELCGNHFNIFGNTNFSMIGPLYLDGAPFGFTQGIITGTDNATYIEIRTFQGGYQQPKAGKAGRIMFFAPNGTMLPSAQYTPEVVTVGTNLSRLVLGSDFWSVDNVTRLQVIKTGNLVSMEYLESTGTGGVYIRGNNGVTLSQIAVYTRGLLFGQGETGPVIVDQWYGVRRPDTSRLNAGGFPLVGFQGGSWQMLNTELGYNFDDITDVQCGVYYAYNQTSPRQVYMPFIDGRQLQVGDTITFYNLLTLQDDGAARVAAITTVKDAAIGVAYSAAFANLGLLGSTGPPPPMIQVTLDRDVTMTSLIDIADILQYQTKYMVFENCYMHDGLAAGIAGKGAQQYIVKNCSVARVQSGINTGISSYWSEGSIARNILIQDNTVEKVPYGQYGGFAAAIGTGEDSSGVVESSITGAVFNNITVSNNTILDCNGPAISLSAASNLNISGNTIIRPMSGVADNSGQASVVIDTASAIYLDVIQGQVDVTGNVIVGIDLQNVPKVIRVSNGSDSQLVNACSNALSGDSENNILLQMPNELWTRVEANSSMVTTTAAFKVVAYSTVGGRLYNNYSVSVAAPRSSATFSFTGTGVQFLTCTGTQYGLARVYLDGIIIQDVDASISLPTVVPDNQAGFCDQLVYSATALPLGQHNLTVQNLDQGGLNSKKGATGFAVSSFSYLTGSQTCQPSSDAASPFAAAQTQLRSAYKKWTSYETTGLVGPNFTAVSFGGSFVTQSPGPPLSSTTTAKLPYGIIPSLAPYLGPVSPLLPPRQQMGPPVPKAFAPATQATTG